MKLTQKSAQAFATLRGSPDFAAVIEWLTEHREVYRDECCTAPPEKVSRSQGKVEVVNSILGAYEAAPATLEKFKTQR